MPRKNIFLFTGILLALPSLLLGQSGASEDISDLESSGDSVEVIESSGDDVGSGEDVYVVDHSVFYVMTGLNGFDIRYLNILMSILAFTSFDYHQFVYCEPL